MINRHCGQSRIVQGVLLLSLVLLAACRPDPTSTIPAAVVSPSASPSVTVTATVEPSLTPTLPPSTTPDPTSTEVSEHVPTLPSPSYSVQVFGWWRPTKEIRRDVGLAADLGFGWIKQTFGWRDIEGIEKGAYDWWFSDQIVQEAEAVGLKVLARIDRQPFWSQGPDAELYLNGPPKDPADFHDFCFDLADRYHGRIGAYQIWNEPNLAREWGESPPDAVAYVELLKACYTGIKAADPEALVISAGLAPTGVNSAEAVPDDLYLQQIYDSGGAAYFDILGLNAPGYKAPPEISPDDAADPDQPWGGHRTFAFRHAEDMRAVMVANGDADKQVAILEMGWTTDPRPDSSYHWHAVTEEEQADYLVRAYQYAAENWPWVGLMNTVYIAKFDWTPDNEEYWWAITYPGFPDTQVRPAYTALQAMEK